MMHRLLQILFNIERSSWTEGGDWHIEWRSMPRHDLGLLLAACVAIAVWMVVAVYRREGSTLPVLNRWLLIALRLIVIAGVVVMLLEPVVIFRRTEHNPSNLLILRDVSGSMDLTDAYTDANAIRSISSALKISEADLQRKTRRQLVDLAFNDEVLKQLKAGGDHLVQSLDFSTRLMPPASTQRVTQSAIQPVTQSAIQPVTQSAIQPVMQAGAPPATQPVTDTSGTAIGVAIRQAIAAYQGKPIAGILLISDGQNNTGETPEKAAQFAMAAGVPIIPLGVGTVQGPRSARITRLDVSDTVAVRDRIPVHVLVESKGLTGPATVVLERARDGGPFEKVGEQLITLGTSGQIQTVNFELTEERKARLELRARLEDAGAELETDDHTKLATVKVINQEMRVLFIAGETFPEVEFIRATLMKPHNGISASCWNQTADANYEQPGKPPITELPQTAEQLKEYDCIILYDPDANLFPPDYSQLLSDFVTKEGGGLVFVAGERNTKNLFDRPDDPSLAWLNLLPVQVEPGLYHTDVSVKLSSQSAWKFDVTPEGKADPIFTFGKPDENDAILESLPGMYWHFPVTRARPGATVLARHGDPRMRNEHGQHVLLATQLVGPGRTFFCAFDSTYRWRYLDDHFFDTFWAHMVERAGRSKQLGGKFPYTLNTDRSEYRPGEQVTLSATFDNPLDRGAGLDALHGEVTRENDPPVDLTLAPRAGDPNTFEATFPVDKAGMHEVRVWAGDVDLKTAGRIATRNVPVNIPNVEYDNPAIDPAGLQAIARPSGSKVYDLSNVKDIASAFTIRKVDLVLEQPQEIWNAPILYGLVLAAIITEWVLRKKMQLV